MSIWAVGLPAELTKRSLVTLVAASRSVGMTPIRSATVTAAPRTSTGLPLDRNPAERSTSVTSNPLLVSQYDNVGPAIPAPEIRRVRVVMALSVRFVSGCTTV
jgi:hypothetical protein